MHEDPAAARAGITPVAADPRRAVIDLPVAGLGWRDRLLQWRAERVADPAFRRWAAGFLPTRWLARRRARSLLRLLTGFVHSQVLLACVRLGLPELLRASPRTPAELAQRCGLPEPAMRQLLVAATALELLEPRAGGRIGLGAHGAALVGDPALAAMIEHHGLLYDDLRDPVGLLRRGGGGGALAGYWAYARRGHPAGVAARQVEPYSALMTASVAWVADEVLDAYPLQRHRCLLDVGGGEGSFLLAASRRAPHLELCLFDLPAVAERARRRLAEAGLEARSRVVGGSFHDGPLPRGADLVTLVRVVHDHDDREVQALFQSVHAALPPGGRLLIAEPMADAAGAGAGAEVTAYFSLYLCAMGQGRLRSAAELRRMLLAAGFARVRRLATRLPQQTAVLVATRVSA